MRNSNSLRISENILREEQMVLQSLPYNGCNCNKNLNRNRRDKKVSSITERADERGLSSVINAERFNS